MNKFKDALNRFFQDRYGMDQLGQALFVLYIITFALNLLTRSMIFYALGLALVFFFLFRCLSKNYEKRRSENEWYLERYNKYARLLRLLKRVWKDRNTHVYRKCPYCKTMIRLPRVKGRHTTNCPKCHKDFEVKV